jgi:hypothetical protein
MEFHYERIQRERSARMGRQEDIRVNNNTSLSLTIKILSTQPRSISIQAPWLYIDVRQWHLLEITADRRNYTKCFRNAKAIKMPMTVLLMLHIPLLEEESIMQRLISVETRAPYLGNEFSQELANYLSSSHYNP